MFLLIALIVQVVQIYGQRVIECKLIQRDADFGQDYYSWTNVASKSQCQNKCKNDYPSCAGFTWVHNNPRSCALYYAEGTEEGVERIGQDSYLCY